MPRRDFRTIERSDLIIVPHEGDGTARALFGAFIGILAVVVGLATLVFAAYLLLKMAAAVFA